MSILPHLTVLPLDDALEEHVDWFIRLRWGAAAAIVLGIWCAPFGSVAVPMQPLLIVAGLVLAYNTVFYCLRRHQGAAPPGRLELQRWVYVQMGLDWLALTLVVHFTGGLRSPVVLAYACHLIIGALLLSRNACFALTMLAITMVGAMVWVESSPWWPAAAVQAPYLGEATSYLRPARWLSISLFFCAVSFLGTTIIQRLREKEADLLRSETELAQACQQLQELYRLGQQVNATLDVSDMLGLLAENGARLLGLRACAIRVLSADGAVLQAGGSFALSEEYLAKGPIVVAESPVDRDVLRGSVVAVRDLQTDSRSLYPVQARAEGLHSVLCVPMIASERAVGVVRLYAEEPHDFTAGERTLAQNLANLGAVAVRNAQSYEDLQTVTDQRDWFARMTHHQLRAPLAAVQTTLDALPYTGELKPDQADLLSRAQKRVSEALEMIRDLLDYAGLASAPVDSAATTELRLVLDHCVDVVNPRAAAKEIDVSLSLPETAAHIAITTADLERILGNLLDNAVKYSPAGGRVQVRARRAGEHVELIVEDSGIGIAPADRDRIFAGFYRTQAAKESGEVGTGLGLSIVQRLVGRWHGTINVADADSGGTQFLVSLPEAETPSDADAGHTDTGSDDDA
jgi:signal transduction histidine kinase